MPIAAKRRLVALSFAMGIGFCKIPTCFAGALKKRKPHMAKKDIDRFLALYREYETLVRDEGMEPKDVEDTSDDLTQNRLRMCRQFRNYLSHQNDPSFLDVSEPMLRFMQSNVDKRKNKRDTLKKHCRSAGTATVTAKDKVGVALERMVKIKSDRLVVVGDGSFGVVSIYDVIGAYLTSKATKTGALKQAKRFAIGAPTDDNGAYADDVVICTADGTSAGAVVGVRYERGE